MIYFTADPHFGDEGFIEVCNRPFNNVEHMDVKLIDNYNTIVTKNDDLYFVGDFSSRSHKYRDYYEYILNSLNGRKHLVLGNHDLNPFDFYAGDRGVGFATVHYPIVKVEEFILSHDIAISIIDKNTMFIVGHVHNMFKRIVNCINVGVDMWDYKPVSIDQIRDFIKTV